MDATTIVGVKAECTCPTCDGALRLVNRGCGSTYEAKCVVACVDCRRRWLLTATLTPAQTRVRA